MEFIYCIHFIAYGGGPCFVISNTRPKLWFARVQSVWILIYFLLRPRSCVKTFFVHGLHNRFEKRLYSNISLSFSVKSGRKMCNLKFVATTFTNEKAA